jgi:benzoyl-CoA reductase subunit C
VPERAERRPAWPVASKVTLDRLVAAGADALAHLPSDRPSLGYVCSYVPEEVILAAGFHPVRLGARPGSTGPADSLLQSFACSFARALLDGLLSGRAAGLSGVVFAYTCDSLRAAMEAWKARAPAGSFIHFLNLPARLEGPGVDTYAASEVRRLADALAGVKGGRQVTAERLAEATRLLADLRRSLGRLGRARSSRPDLLPGSVFIAAARGAQALERSEAARLLAALAEELEGAAAAGSAGAVGSAGAAGSAGAVGSAGAAATRRPQTAGRPRLLVSGGYLETEQPLRLIEEAGADVVADDLCLGWRHLAFAEDDEPSGLAELAARYLRRVPCAAKHPPEPRFDFVVRLADEHQVAGGVFLLQKFCDPHAFDYPALRDRLEATGRPTLLLEVEQGSVASGQARTRLEAFVERLRAGGGSP